MSIWHFWSDLCNQLPSVVVGSLTSKVFFRATNASDGRFFPLVCWVCILSCPEAIGRHMTRFHEHARYLAGRSCTSLATLTLRTNDLFSSDKLYLRPVRYRVGIWVLSPDRTKLSDGGSFVVRIIMLMLTSYNNIDVHTLYHLISMGTWPI